MFAQRVRTSRRRAGTRLALFVSWIVGAGLAVGAPTDVGADGATYFRFNGLEVNDFVYDSTRDLIYATVGGHDPTYPNQIVTIDPHTHSITANGSFGVRPYALEISDDDSVLYVAIDNEHSVKKLSLPSFTVEWSHAFIDPTKQDFFVSDMDVMPGSNDTVAVAEIGSGAQDTGVVILDGGVPRPHTTSFSSNGSDTIEFDDSGTRVFGASLYVGERLQTFSVDAAGLGFVEGTNLGGGYILQHKGLLYGSHVILDVKANPMAQVAEVPFALGIAIDSDMDALYYYVPVLENDAHAVYMVAYNLTSRTKVGQVKLPSGNSFRPLPMESLGNHVLAYKDTGPGFGPGEAGTIVIADFSAVFPPPVDLKSSGEYTPLTPERILDTRSGVGRDGVSGPVGAGVTIDVQITGRGGVPSSGVDNVVMNVTAVAPTQGGYLTIFPAGTARPTISSLNFAAGNTLANLVTMPVGIDGKVSIFNPAGQVHVLFDVAGFYSSADGPDGLRFHPIEPRRILDTRLRVGTKLGPTQTKAVSAAGSAGIPVCCPMAVAINVTVTNTTSAGFVTVFPSDVMLPNVSNVNFAAGATRANQVIVRLSAGGSFTIYNDVGHTDVIVDIVGYYDDVEDGHSGRFVSFAPHRVVDTRLESSFPPPGDMWSDTTYVLKSFAPVSAYVLNVTVTAPTWSGFIAAYPYRSPFSPLPNVSTVNYAIGETVANHAIVRADPHLAFYNWGGHAHLIVDALGGFI